MSPAALRGSWPRDSARSGRPELGRPLDEVHGPVEARGTTVAGTQIHSVRLPSFVVSTEIVFAAEGERLTLRHDPGESPAPYVAGTLLAIRSVPGRVGLTRGLRRRPFTSRRGSQGSSGSRGRHRLRHLARQQAEAAHRDPRAGGRGS